MPRFGKQPIISILLAQALVSGFVAGALAIWLGRTAGVSALLGGVVAVVPNAFLAARLIAPKAGSSAQAMLKAAWLGEIGKLLLTALLFAAVFVSVRPISVLGVFGGFIAAQFVVFGAMFLSDVGSDEIDGKTKQ